MGYPAKREPRARTHYALLDDADSQTAPAEVRAGLRRFLERPDVCGPILEVGTGVGGNLRDLAKAFPTYGVEVSVSAARKAAELAPVVLGDGGSLPFGDAIFGTVVCTEVLEHVESPAAVFAEMARVLRSGGTAFVTTPNYSNVAGLHKWLADQRSGRRDWNPWGAHHGGYEAFMTGHRLWRAARVHFDLIAVRGLDYGQALTGRFALADRLAATGPGHRLLRRALPRMYRATGRLAWHGMHVELTLRRRSDQVPAA